MATTTAIQGVDETLRQVATAALAGQVPAVAVTLGPLDRPDNRPRVNWFLYQISTNRAYANMEPPRTGWRTARGRPPLALQLDYLLTSYPAPFTSTGDEVQFSHRAMAAVMSALHDNGIISDGDPRLSPLAGPLIEPLRVSPADIDSETVTKLFTAATQPMRLSTAYRVSLVTVEPAEAHVAGPPVQRRSVTAIPSMGPRLSPRGSGRIIEGTPFEVGAIDVPSYAEITLRRTPDDPAGPPGDWPLTVVDRAVDALTLQLDDGRPVPGARLLDVRTRDAGIQIGEAILPLLLAPAVTAHAGLGVPGTDIVLTTTNVASDVEVFVAGRQVPPAAVTFTSPTQVRFTVQPGMSGPAPISLRSRKVAGPVHDGLVLP